MASRPSTDLAELTTLRLGGPADRVVEATSEAELIEAVEAADERGEPVLLVGGGSNLVVSDAGFEGTVVLVRSRGVRVEHDGHGHDGHGGVGVTVDAGENWDALAARAVEEHWAGVEALSGIPGLVGAVPIQNVGAYGQEVAQTITSVRTYERGSRAVRTYVAGDCGFGYRTSRFKSSPDQQVILSVTFEFEHGEMGAPIAYDELAQRLGINVGDRATSSAVRRAVLGLRASKGMVLDPGDHDTWSAGSFFTNPVLGADEAASLPPGAPRFEQADGRVKTSAAWLIDRSGFGKGYGEGAAQLSGKHALALTNRGGASTADLLELAREVRAGVESKYGIRLVNEPVLVNCQL